jgi:phenylalanyl-tRNA synthetase beta chain
VRRGRATGAGLVEALVDELGRDATVRREGGGPPALHPGQAMRWLTAEGEPLAWAGALHPELAAALARPCLVAEIDLGRLLAGPRRPARHEAQSRYPAVSRDLSLVLPRAVAYERLLAVLAAVEPPAPVRFEALDRYTGGALGPEVVSLTVRATLEPRERTLTDPETETYRQALIAALDTGLGAKIRE